MPLFPLRPELFPVVAGSGQLGHRSGDTLGTHPWSSGRLMPTRPQSTQQSPAELLAMYVGFWCAPASRSASSGTAYSSAPGLGVRPISIGGHLPRGSSGSRQPQANGGSRYDEARRRRNWAAMSSMLAAAASAKL